MTGAYSDLRQRRPQGHSAPDRGGRGPRRQGRSGAPTSAAAPTATPPSPATTGRTCPIAGEPVIDPITAYQIDTMLQGVVLARYRRQAAHPRPAPSAARPAPPMISAAPGSWASRPRSWSGCSSASTTTARWARARPARSRPCRSSSNSCRRLKGCRLISRPRPTPSSPRSVPTARPSGRAPNPSPGPGRQRAGGGRKALRHYAGGAANPRRYAQASDSRQAAGARQGIELVRLAAYLARLPVAGTRILIMRTGGAMDPPNYRLRHSRVRLTGLQYGYALYI